MTLGATEAIFSAIQAVIGAGRRGHRLRSRLRLLRAGGAPRRRALRAPAARAAGVPLRLGAGARRRSPRAPACCCSTARTTRPAPPPVPPISRHWRSWPPRATCWCCPTRSMSTWCSTARGITACCSTRSWRGAASRCSRSARPCTPPGLRVGYCVAPAPLTRELRKVHQFNTFSISHPLQHAIAGYLDAQPRCGEALAALFPGQARPAARAPWRTRASACRRPRGRISSCSTTAPSRATTTWPSPNGC